MKKLFILFLISLLFAGGINAQKPLTFSGGLRLGLPVGDWSDYWSLGLGGELQGEGHLSSTVTGLFSAGYTSFFGKTISGIEFENIGLIPILVGVRGYPSSSFFVGGKVGYGILTGGGSSEGGFNWEPHIGYNGNKLQVSLGYNGLTKEGETLGHIALLALIKFN